jgi:hypothetical protein
MIWTTIDTPSPLDKVIVSPSEVNVIAIGSDGRTFYAVDIATWHDDNANLVVDPNETGRVYKSTDGGITWQQELSAQLIAAGASMPVWNIAVAPDDVNFVVAVTDSTGVPGGPKQVFISTNGGAQWYIAVNGLSLAGTEFISCVDVSVIYDGTNRDIAIGTRTVIGTGRVYTMKTTGFAAWADQGLPASDVVALKFSPTYPSDSSLVVISSDFVTDTRLHLGIHDTAVNTTAWDTVIGYPVQILDTSFAGTSPTAPQIITADLELPSDFSGQDVALRRFYVGTDVTIAGVQFGVYRIDDTVPYRINPPTSGRISSIAYFGAYISGVLLAGEVTAVPALGLVNVWRTSNPIAVTPTWLKSDTNKSPTGGGRATPLPVVGNFANAQLAWSPDGTRAYCGTSSANPVTGGTAPWPWLPGSEGQWPRAWITSVQFDESAFSVSPYAPAYEQLLNSFSKTKDSDIGNIWNQLSLIDTEIDFLTDVAALDAPQAGENLATNDYDILYLCSKNNAAFPVRFNSVWRSTSDPLGRTWERILCTAATNNDVILRVRQPSYDETDRSDVIVFANLGTAAVGYSANEGQIWDIRSLTLVTDLALASDTVIYILNNTLVYRYELVGTGWVQKNKVDTQLDAGHTIAVPLKNPPKTGGTEATKDMVLVGEAGPPAGMGRIVYADFSDTIVKIGPPDYESIAPPVAGDAHVIFDDKFEQTGIIYNATNDPISGNGKIYSWVIEKSTAWNELEPPNAEFYGLAQRNDVLYGAWKTPGVPATAPNTAGVDRTLYPRVKVPPPPQWDYLVAELPITVLFTREPTSLKISSNENISLWAIDDYQPYDFANNEGCLWEYTDTLAKVGPWTTSPPSGSFIPVDPKSGRAVEVNFAWRQLSYSTVYELQIAKDIDFYNRVLVNDHITPVDQLAPVVYLPAGALIPASGSNIGSWGNLESGHTYYWRVRARATVTGEIVRSPWSATMYFTVEAGLRTTSPYPTVTLFSPMYGARNISTSPGFSWSGLPGTTKYEFILAKDAALQQVIVKVNVPMTSSLYDGKLDYNTSYFWQVRAIEPVVSDPSPIGTFTVIAEEKPTAPVVEQPTAIPSWVWSVIAVCTVLAVAMIVFTMVRPRYIRNGGGKLFKVEPIVGKPEKPMVKPAGGKLDNLKPLFNKLKSRIAKIWGP